ncbi:MAG: trigger factor [Candidatus Aminicenantes bacterium]|nr:trigger factor [Candidatus Aminicenantes bacterium]
MKVELKEISSYQRELLIEVPADIVQQEIDRASQTIKKTARLPGFRPGKTPIPIIKSRFSREIKDEVLNKLLPRYYEEALKQHHLSPISPPVMDDITVEEGEPLRFKASFEVKPPIKVENYEGLKGSHPEVKVTPEEVETALRNLQERGAQLVTVEGRGVQSGDWVMLDIVEQFDPPTQGGSHREENALIEVGSPRTFEGFSQQLMGMNRGQERSFTIDYPPDLPRKKLAGKKVHYKVKLKEIKIKEIPTLDDEFARDLGDLKNLGDLREKMEKDLLSRKEDEAERALTDELLGQLSDAHTFEVPPYLVEQELDHRVSRVANNFVMQGIDLKRVEFDWDKFRQEQRPDAIKSVKKWLIVEQIAHQENIVVTPDEVQTEIERIAAENNKSVAYIKGWLQKEGRMEELKNQLIFLKTVDFLKKKAIIVNKGEK